MLENPDKMTGLNLDSKVYVFGTWDSEYSEPEHCSLLFGIRDRDLFMENLSTVLYDEIEFENNGDYLYYCDYEIAIVLYKDFGYATFDPDGYRRGEDIDIDELTAGLEQEKDITSVPAFKSLASSDSDLYAMVDAGIFITDEIYGEYSKVAESAKMTVPDFSGSYLCAALNFENEEIQLTAGVDFPAKERQRLEKEYSSYYNTIKGSHLKYFSEDAIAVMAFNIDFKEFFSKTGIFSELSLPSIVEDVLESVDGEVSIGIDNIDLDRYGDLEDIDAMLTAKVRNDDFLESAGRMVGASEVGEKAYSVNIDDGLDIHFGVDGKNLYISTSPASRQGLLQKSDNYQKKYGSFASGAYSYIGLDVKELADVMKDELDEETLMILSSAEFVGIRQSSLFESEVTVYFNGNKNPLETAVSLLQDYLNMSY